MERRELFRILAAGAAATQGSAQHQHTPGAENYASYKPRFFSTAEYDTLDRLCEIVIPADGQSPGAKQAQVRFFIDTMLHYSDATTQQRWRAGLTAVENSAQAKFGMPFSRCGADQQEAVVALMARNEGAPETELERFFGPLKRMTVDGFHLSDVGSRQHFGYKGNVSVAEFPGCTHPEHQA